MGAIPDLGVSAKAGEARRINRSAQARGKADFTEALCAVEASKASFSMCLVFFVKWAQFDSPFPDQGQLNAACILLPHGLEYARSGRRD